MKIIFLDIDGVLNCENAYRNGECQYQEWIWEDGRKDHYQRFCVRSKELLNKLIDETGAKIVISSTWRHSGIDFMKKVWEMEEMKGEIIGIKASPKYIIEPKRTGRTSNRADKAETAACASPAFKRQTPSQCKDSPTIGSSDTACSMASWDCANTLQSLAK